jgi:hypothetical protein
MKNIRKSINISRKNSEYFVLNKTKETPKDETKTVPTR